MKSLFSFISVILKNCRAELNLYLCVEHGNFRHDSRAKTFHEPSRLSSFDPWRISSDKSHRYDIDSTNQFLKRTLINDMPGEQVCQVTYNGLCQSQIFVREVLVKKRSRRSKACPKGGKISEISARIIDFIWTASVKWARSEWRNTVAQYLLGSEVFVGNNSPG